MLLCTYEVSPPSDLYSPWVSTTWVYSADAGEAEGIRDAWFDVSGEHVDGTREPVAEWGTDAWVEVGTYDSLDATAAANGRVWLVTVKQGVLQPTNEQNQALKPSLAAYLEELAG